MRESKADIARALGQAYYEALCEGGTLKEGYEAFFRLEELLREVPSLKDALSGYGDGEEEALLLGEVRSSIGGPREFANFLKIAHSRKLFGRFADISHVFGRLADEALGIWSGTVYSAHPLSEIERNGILAALEKETGRELSLEFKVQEGLLGGFRAYVGGKCYDYTLEGSLKRLSADLLREAEV